jgi:hypothetical protein
MKIAAAARRAGKPTTSVRKMAKYTERIVFVRLKEISPEP